MFSNFVSSFNRASGNSILGNQGYGPYGKQRYTAGSIDSTTTKGFTGQYNDNQTGLDYYGARYYDPAAGRFLSADSVQGNAQGMDPYAYVGGNPETLTDPTGNRESPGQLGTIEPINDIGPSSGAAPDLGTGIGQAIAQWIVRVGIGIAGVGTAINTTLQGIASLGASSATDITYGRAVNSLTYATPNSADLTYQHAVNSVTFGGYQPNSGGLGFQPGGQNNPQTQTGGGDQGGYKPPQRPTAPPPDQPSEDGKNNPPDLYRSGNASGPKTNKIRLEGENADVHPDENNLICPNEGGLSTFEKPNRPGKWWKLPKGTELPDGLQFRNDHGDHWLIEPSKPMTVDDFVQLLQSINGWERCP